MPQGSNTREEFHRAPQGTRKGEKYFYFQPLRRQNADSGPIAGPPRFRNGPEWDPGARLRIVAKAPDCRYVWSRGIIDSSGFSSTRIMANCAIASVMAAAKNTSVKVATEVPARTRWPNVSPDAPMGTAASTMAPTTTARIVLRRGRTEFMVPIAPPR